MIPYAEHTEKMKQVSRYVSLQIFLRAEKTILWSKAAWKEWDEDHSDQYNVGLHKKEKTSAGLRFFEGTVDLKSTRV